jgi:F0F1-type ATP synthase membrane subunit a
MCCQLITNIFNNRIVSIYWFVVILFVAVFSSDANRYIKDRSGKLNILCTWIFGLVNGAFKIRYWEMPM